MLTYNFIATQRFFLFEYCFPFSYRSLLINDHVLLLDTINLVALKLLILSRWAIISFDEGEKELSCMNLLFKASCITKIYCSIIYNNSLHSFDAVINFERIYNFTAFKISLKYQLLLTHVG